MRRRFTLAIYFACCCSLVFPNSIFSADWVFSPSISLREEYDSNVLFSSQDEQDDFVTSIRPVFSLIGETEKTRFRLDPAFKIQKYLENSSLDDIHYDINATLTQRVSERFSADFSSHFLKDSTLETQLEQAGVRTQRAERYGFDFGLGETYALSERMSISAKESVGTVLYPDGEFPDTRFLLLEAGLAYQLSPRDTARFSATYSTTDYDFSPNERRSAEISTLQEMIIWERELNETTSMSLGAGHRKTWSESSRPELVFDPERLAFRTVKKESVSSDDGTVFLAFLRKAWSERFSTVLSAGKEQYSNVDATSLDRTYAGLEVSYRISELTTFASTLRYDHNKETGAGNQEIDYVRFVPSIEWKLTEHSALRFAGSYEHEHRTGLGLARDADRFKAWIEFVYWWPRFGENR